ncbi:MAG: PHB depolymerase family esterase [Planctomycetota bacterium]
MSLGSGASYEGAFSIESASIEGGPEPLGCEHQEDAGDIALFSPVHYESGYAYPLIVWLHGEEGHEDELPRVMPHMSVRNHVGVAPRGTQRAGSGYRWSESGEDLGDAADRVLAAVDAAKERYHIHAERVFLAGYQCGGTMAVRIALEYPEVFAGAASVEGRVPRGGRPLRNINRARKTPLLLATSLEDDALSVSTVNEDLRLLHSAGMAVAMRLYPGGDGLATNMLSDIDAWVMERVCAPAHACS